MESPVRVAMVMAPGRAWSCVSLIAAVEKPCARGSELAVVVAVLDRALDDRDGVTLWHAAARASAQTATPSQTRRTP